MFKHARMRLLNAEDFLPVRPPVTLRDDEIHLWFFPQCGIAVSARGDYERCLRDLLAPYLQIDARALLFERDPHGKPFLARLPATAALQFNLSHTGAALLVGISRSQALGVDLETVQRTRPWTDLAQRYFAADESSALAALPPEQQTQAFLDLWSCKEAVLKALGRGIAFGLHRLSFALDAAGAVTGLAQIADEAGQHDRWQVVRLRPDASLVGALAWYGTARNVRAFQAIVD
jgi:4'-phosphopantetheinyl transferase